MESDLFLMEIQHQHLLSSENVSSYCGLTDPGGTYVRQT